MTWDVTIYGAGVFGLSCAWEMTRRGARVRVVDPFGVGAGASGGIVGALAPHVPEAWNPKKAFQLDSLLASASFWSGVEQAGGLPTGYGRTGRLQPVADAAALTLARTRADGAQSLWQGHATWTLVPAQGVAWAPPSPTGWLIHDTLTGRIHPAQACQALAAAVTARGGWIGAEASPGAEPCLWATGATGLAELSHGRRRAVGVPVKGQAALLQPQMDLRDAPQLFIGGLHVVPHADGTVAIGSTTERDVTDTNTDAQLDALIAQARAHVPVLAEAPVIGRWAGLRPRARSRAPLLGPHPDRPGHFVANGGFKIGFGVAPGVARLMADLILDGQDAIPPAFRLEASF